MKMDNVYFLVKAKCLKWVVLQLWLVSREPCSTVWPCRKKLCTMTSYG